MELKSFGKGRFIGRGIAVLALATVVAAPAAAEAVTATSVATHSASDVHVAGIGGKIKRSEVISRAAYWVKHQPGPYSQKAYSYDPEKKHKYRRDCSGYVSMAWHAKTSYATSTIHQVSKKISRKNLAPGDIMNIAGTHMFLFGKWDNKQHTRFTYYSFGSTPVKMRHAGINDARFDGHANKKYVARRYVNIV